MRTAKLGILFYILVYLSSYALGENPKKFGHEVGNGGDVIVCGQNPPQVLDYFLYQQAGSHRSIDVGPGDEFAKVRFVLDRLKHRDGVRAHRYLTRLDAIWPQRVAWIHGFELIDLPDAGHIPTAGCALRQAVIQRTLRHPALMQITVQGDIWADLDATARAGLILHELVYEEVLELGQNHSKNVRAYNAAISSGAFSQMTQGQYDALVNQLFAIPEPVAFKMDRFTYYVAKDMELNMSLRDMIATTESELRWQLFGAVPAWVHLRDQSELNMTPSKADVGLYAFDLTASTAFFSTAVPIHVLVLENSNYPPVWLVPGIAVRLGVSQVELDLAPLASDMENDELRFAKVSGPPTANVTPEGKLQAQPHEGPENHSLWIEVRDGHFRSLLEVQIGK